MLMNSHLTSASSKEVSNQVPRQEVASLKAKFKPTLPKKSEVDGWAIRSQQRCLWELVKVVGKKFYRIGPWNSVSPNRAAVTVFVKVSFTALIEATIFVSSLKAILIMSWRSLLVFKWDLNSDHQSRRWACWPLGHPKSPIFNIASN